MSQFGGAADLDSLANLVGDILGIVNISRALTDFEEDEKGIRTVYTLGGKQTLLTVYEPGLYRLIFKSRKPEAKRFQKWVFGEVLPSLRKHGTYPPPQQLTNAFSKKVENLEHAVALHFFVYNFIARHGAIRMPPALKAKVADHVWSYEELVELIDRPQTG